MERPSLQDSSTYSNDACTEATPRLAVIPQHVAIIMDGNNRWAAKNRKGRLAGHRAGVESVRRIIKACGHAGVKVLTLFAFSSENWKRPAEEVRGLMQLFLQALKLESARLQKQRIRLRVIGDISAFSPLLQRQIRNTERLTENNHRVTLVIAAGYGGQWDIVQTAQKLAEKVKAGLLDPGDISSTMFEQHLSTHGLPPPDLLIRTSGERRISNFLLWQCAYTEFYFSDVLWPDFGAKEFFNALCSFNERQRRFGCREPENSYTPKI